MILLLLHYIGHLPKKKKNLHHPPSFLVLKKKVYASCRNKPFVKMGNFLQERLVWILTGLCSVFEAFWAWGSGSKGRVTCLKERCGGAAAGTAKHRGQLLATAVPLSKWLESPTWVPGIHRAAPVPLSWRVPLFSISPFSPSILRAESPPVPPHLSRESVWKCPYKHPEFSRETEREKGGEKGRDKREKKRERDQEWKSTLEERRGGKKKKEKFP